VWINGYGWPVYRGGPMWYGDSIGLDKVVAKLKQYDPGAQISPLLEKLAKEGKKFQQS
jgi:3-hydroxyacyl-CoA dehydrogenase